jgi:4-oxalocrotonate tautomerase
MPIIKVEMFAGRDREQKRKLVKALTDAMVETTGASRDAVWVVINDVEKEDWGFGGELGDRQVSLTGAALPALCTLVSRQGSAHGIYSASITLFRRHIR